MLKFLTPLALAALTAISIAPQAQAFPINIDSITIGQSSRSSQPRIVVKIGGQPDYSNRWKSDYRQRESDRRRYDPYSRSDRYSAGRGDYYRHR